MTTKKEEVDVKSSKKEQTLEDKLKADIQQYEYQVLKANSLILEKQEQIDKLSKEIEALKIDKATLNGIILTSQSIIKNGNNS